MWSLFTYLFHGFMKWVVIPINRLPLPLQFLNVRKTALLRVQRINHPLAFGSDIMLLFCLWQGIGKLWMPECNTENAAHVVVCTWHCPACPFSWFSFSSQLRINPFLIFGLSGVFWWCSAHSSRVSEFWHWTNQDYCFSSDTGKKYPSQQKKKDII